MPTSRFKPFTDFPQAEKPFTENPQQINTNKTKEKKKKSKTIVLESGAPVNVHIKDALGKFINACKGESSIFDSKGFFVS